jgi:hypothetical protein
MNSNINDLLADFQFIILTDLSYAVHNTRKTAEDSIPGMPVAATVQLCNCETVRVQAPHPRVSYSRYACSCNCATVRQQAPHPRVSDTIGETKLSL